MAQEARLTREARRIMAADLAMLLTGAHTGAARCEASVTDLMEAAHNAYSEGCLRHADGQPLTFRQIVELTCRRMGIGVPRNPRSRAARAAMRKGMRGNSLLECYRLWLAAGADGNTGLRRLQYSL
jgi:hypothetical protein